ncbi:MAG: hypothetical protein QOD72_2559 [Acidimicrobiaceae bacterium]|jgi:hypothetical protein|nr:hypothetical protein [Acidimicrobiaceae bacterium]
MGGHDDSLPRGRWRELVRALRRERPTGADIVPPLPTDDNPQLPPAGIDIDSP